MGRSLWESAVYHRPRPDDRQRDLFPLPQLQVDESVGKHLSRSVRRRVDRRAAVGGRVNHAIDALNLLFSGHGSPAGFSEMSMIGSLPLHQQEAINGIIQSVKYLGDPPADACGQGALKALRAAPSMYEDTAGGVGDVVPMSLPQLSLPSGVVAGVDLLGALEEPVKGVVAQFEDTMLQDADVWTAISSNTCGLTPYNDPALLNPRLYLVFLRHLYDRGILDFADGCKGRVGAFTVSKKPKLVGGSLQQRQRLVLDCRQTNLLFRPAPHTRLGSLAAISEMYIPPGHNMYLSGADIKDCFYAVRLPKDLAMYFGLHRDLSVEEATLVSGLGAEYFSGYGNITPVISVLPMGFSWSFFLVQHIHESVSMRALGISHTELVLEHTPAPKLVPGQAIAMPYCDNVHAIGLEQQLTNNSKDSICNALSHIGFSMHEDEPASTTFNTLGGVVDGQLGQVRATSSRMWNLIFAFMHIRRGVIHPEVVQRLLGHSMVLCVLNRCGMGVFHQLYKFAMSSSGPRCLNRRERQECYIFAGIVPLLYSDLRRPLEEEIHCTDASPDGFGICSMPCSNEEVSRVARWNERWRFRRLPPEEWQPRRRALGLDVFGDVRSVTGDTSALDDLDNYVDNPLFEEVPCEMLDPNRWSTKKMGKWEYTGEHITLKEGRALVLCARRLARSSKYRGKRHVVLVDNLGLALAVSKGRACNYKLLRIIQQLSALSLACSFSLRLRWVPSEKNVADGPSRGQIDPGPYKEEPCHETSDHGSHENVEGAAVKSSESCPKSAKTHDEDSQEGFSSSHESLVDSPSSSHASSWKSCMSGRDRCRETSSEQEDDSVRGEECVQGDPSPVHFVLQPLQEFLPARRFAMAAWKRLRPGHGGLPRHSLLGEPFSKRRREGGGSLGIPSPRAQGQDDPLKESIEGLEERDAPKEPVAHAGPSDVWSGHGPSRKRQEDHGCEGDHGLRCIPETWRKHRTKSKGCVEASSKRRPTIPTLLHHHQGSRGHGSGQSRSLRQHRTVQHSRKAVHWGDGVASGSNSQSPQGSPVPFHLRAVQEGVPDQRQEAGSREPTSLSAATWRGIRGHECQDSGTCSDQVSREMAHRSKREKVCQNREAAAVVKPTLSRSSGILSMVEEQHGVGAARANVPKDHVTPLGWLDVMKLTTLPVRFALEIFAGTARITQALHDRGICAFPIDICMSPLHNLLDISVEHRILHWLQACRVTFLWLGMPCTSFSRARKWDGLGPGPLRDSNNLFGFNWLTADDARKVRTGNNLLRITIRFLETCEKYHIPYALENPRSSYAWDMPIMKRFIATYKPQLIHLDFCQYGEEWRKPTTIMGNFWTLPAVSRICTSKKGICSRTHRPHFALSGTDENNVFWTLRAQPYPRALCREVAATVAQNMAV